MRRVTCALILAACAACAPAPGADTHVTAAGLVPAEVFAGSGALRLGDPVAVALDFEARAVIADGAPGRLLRWKAGEPPQEFQQPSGASFYPSDVAVRGFLIYAVDEASRRILRFDESGAYRDVLLNFEQLQLGRRVSPFSLAVDESGRLAVSDVENHQVLLFDNYLSLETGFGNYGSFDGQLDTPQGVSFSRAGDIVVADTGNRRVQVFSDGGTLRRVVPATGAANPLRRPRRAAVTADGRVFVADPAAGGVFEFDAAGAFVRAVVPEGVARFAPSDVVRSREGALFVTDGATRSLYVFKGI